MTPVGHSIMGASIGVLVIPLNWRTKVKAGLMLGFIVLANAPDLRLPHWGHERYDISHSLFVSLAFVLCLSIPFHLSSNFRKIKKAQLVLSAIGLAWLSHILLDTFYNHGHGLAMFWPFSSAHLSLAIPWFETLKKPLPHLDSHSIRVCFIEFISYGFLFCLALMTRLYWHRQNTRKSEYLE